MKSHPKVLMAKTNLDGHWRGVTVVSAALRDAGFEVIMLGSALPDEIAVAAMHEDVDLVGLNVGGRVEVVERVITRIREEAGPVPVLVGGVLPPYAVRRLTELGIECFPPGSSLDAIVSAARRLSENYALTRQ
jgi:methylmalonyl-CoA mutase C-terminal domain/subunit